MKIVNDCAEQKDLYVYAIRPNVEGAYIVCRFTAVLKFRTEQQAKLAFFQNLGYKYIELLAIEFHETPVDNVKGHAQRCYAQLKVPMN